MEYFGLTGRLFFDLETLGDGVYLPDSATLSIHSPVKDIDIKRSRLTFFYDSVNENSDRLSMSGYLKPGFTTMPFSNDVTVRVEVADPRFPDFTDLVIFTQTIPAGTVSGTKKYRFTSGGVEIRDLRFEPRTSSTYFYAFVEKVELLKAMKAQMTPDQYLAFIQGISNCKVTIEVDDQIWVGGAFLKPSTLTNQKQELILMN